MSRWQPLDENKSFAESWEATAGRGYSTRCDQQRGQVSATGSLLKEVVAEQAPQHQKKAA
jgi:hypothetical protein